MHAMTRQSDTQRHLDRIRELARDKKSLEARCAALEAALTRIATLDETITYLVVGEGKHAVLHSCSSSGTVKQLVTVARYTETETTYARVWAPVPPVDGSVAAIAADALLPAEMSVVGDEMEARAS